jgi:hypothetical protein
VFHLQLLLATFAGWVNRHRHQAKVTGSATSRHRQVQHLGGLLGSYRRSASTAVETRAFLAAAFLGHQSLVPG